MANVTQQIRTTCPRDCYDTCGVVVVTYTDKIAHVRGDPTHSVSRGKLCAKDHTR
jgi:anaerobic selenocysteine-containing dehydrogenase